METIERIREDEDAQKLSRAMEITDSAPTLADMIRLGSKFTKQAVGDWGNGEDNSCAMSAAVSAATALGYME